MISFTHYQTGAQVARELIRSPEDIVEFLEELAKFCDEDPDLIGEIHNDAVEQEACKTLRQLGTILSNMQGD